MPGQVGAANSTGVQQSGGVTTIQEPAEIAFGGDVTTPDLYIGSDPSEFSAGLLGNLSGDQMIIAFYGTSANRFSNLQAVIETTDFGMAAIQALAVTKGDTIGPTAIQGVAGNSGTNLLPDAIGFRANLRCYAAGDVTKGIGFQSNCLGGAAAGNFIAFVAFEAPNPLAAPDGPEGTVTGFRSTIDGAGNFQVNAEGNAPSRFAGAKFLLPNLPTADPTVAGQLWVDAAAGRVVKQSAG